MRERIITRVFLLRRIVQLLGPMLGFEMSCVHYVLDDARANEESIYFSKETDSKLSPEEGGEEEQRGTRSVLGPISPVSAIQADLRGFALEKICGGETFAPF